MPGFRNPRPMATRPQQERDQYDHEDARDDTERVNGEPVRVTNYSDGSSTYHWGGPCGSTSYDEYGEEI